MHKMAIDAINRIIEGECPSEVLSEGKFDAATTEIVRWFVKRLKRIIERKPLKSHQVLLPSRLLDKYKVRSRNVSLFVTMPEESPENHTFKISGSFSRDTTNIDIEVYLPSHFPDEIGFSGYVLRNESWNLFIYRMKEVLRHELEHSDQDFKNKRYADYPEVNGGIFPNVTSAISYFLHKREIEAYAAGFYKKAKTSKRTITYYIHKHLDYIERVLDKLGADRGLISHTKKAVKTRLLHVINKRYPKAVKE